MLSQRIDAQLQLSTLRQQTAFNMIHSSFDWAMKAKLQFTWGEIIMSENYIAPQHFPFDWENGASASGRTLGPAFRQPPRCATPHHHVTTSRINLEG